MTGSRPEALPRAFSKDLLKTQNWTVQSLAVNQGSWYNMSEMPEKSWLDAIKEILSEEPGGLHYTEIAQQIADKGLRTSLGATPNNTVNVYLNQSLTQEGAGSPFIKVSKGHYAMRSLFLSPPAEASVPDSGDEGLGHEGHVADGELEPREDEEDTGLIRAFGMFWSRSYVKWGQSVRLLGKQQQASQQVDFSGERGVYLLHDGRAVVYVGRAIDQGLGTRLKQHTLDRLSGRWDRFSWFGIYQVTDNGTLNESVPNSINAQVLISTMEALLIEGLEPPQNRKRGDDFRAIEFIQLEDPEIQKAHTLALIDQLKNSFLETNS